MSSNDRQHRLGHAVSTARDTRQVLIDRNVLSQLPAMFERHFPANNAVVVGDKRTMEVAGRAAEEALRSAGVMCQPAFVFEDDDLYAEHQFVERLEQSLTPHDAIPIAIGSGTINDVTKLAAHRCGRQYLAVATAASMDGYTAYGASITFEGSKQTFDCPAPRAVLADLAIVSNAPPSMGASGYADLLAKVTAGADWIVADALGIESIDDHAWELVQTPLHGWLENPAGVKSGDESTIANLLEGLMMSGLAMQSTMSSRPASGAEHQFSHLWDMQHHTHNGAAPSHGFKVGIATAAVGRLYEKLLARDVPKMLDVENAVSHWPDKAAMDAEIRRLFDDPAIREKALLESGEKWISREQLRSELNKLREVFPTIRERLATQLFTEAELKQRLVSAGAPSESPEIGIDPQRLAHSHRLAYYIRRRYTILDLVMRCGWDADFEEA